VSTKKREYNPRQNDKRGGGTVETSVTGRVKNISVSLSKPLVPLFEAISNSIDAIQENNEGEGRIDIEILRDEGSLFKGAESSTERQLAEINGFTIRDNGVGFNERNYREFNVADTTYKAKSGGRGVGRFTWLRTFKQVEIESHYFENGQHKRRDFIFTLSETGIEGHKCDNEPGEQRETIVRLVDYEESYRKRCPKKLDIIAAFIVEEFLDIFLGASCPEIFIHDAFTNDEINLDDFFKSVMLTSKLENIEIKGHSFDLIHAQLHSTHISEHRIYYCAKNRAVKPEKLLGIPNLPSRLTADTGEEFIYSVYVSSPLLDEYVNSDRMGFSIPEENVPILADEVSLADIRLAVKERCKQYLSRYTEPLKKKKREKIDRYMEGNGVMYRPILSKLDKAFDDIDIEATDAEIDLRLYQEYQKIQLEIRRQGQDLLREVFADFSDYEKFKGRLLEHFTNISEMGQSDLARYIVQRKMFIEFLRKLLALRADGKYTLEDKIHTLICPRWKTSDTLTFEGHNLWLIDERLAYYIFLSSDKQIKTIPLLESEGEGKPDIIIFDKAFAFAESKDAPFSTITIIEFKKPLRNEYDDKENPFNQVAGYSEIIRSGKAKYADGRAMPVNPNIPIYAYIICDLTPRLEWWAKMAGLQKSADGLGYFGHMNQFSIYVEVMSYEKVLIDSDKRHTAFFEKLGISVKYEDTAKA
jgi:hypothetical protein